VGATDRVIPLGAVGL